MLHQSGLGAGIAARAMHGLNLALSIIEIDPLVYKYAREYFGLHKLHLRVESSPTASSSSFPSFTSQLNFPDHPDQTDGKDGTIYIEDARMWVHRRSRVQTSGRPVDINTKEGSGKFENYDYVIHDVFSGGSVPTHLFTKEFWRELKSLLRENGVLAVVRLSLCLFGDELMRDFTEFCGTVRNAGFERSIFDASEEL